MKVQLQGQSLRLRIDEDELACLLAGGDVLNETRAAPGVVACQRVRLLPGAAVSEAPGAVVGGGAGTGEDVVVAFAASGGEWRFDLPETAVRDYVARLPCRDALEFELPAGGFTLKLAFEVDVRDSVRHRGPPPRRRPA